MCFVSQIFFVVDKTSVIKSQLLHICLNQIFKIQGYTLLLNTDINLVIQWVIKCQWLCIKYVENTKSKWLNIIIIKYNIEDSVNEVNF